MLITKKYIPRRTFLSGAGAVLALPVLDAMTPALTAETTRPIRRLRPPTQRSPAGQPATPASAPLAQSAVTDKPA